MTTKTKEVEPQTTPEPDSEIRDMVNLPALVSAFGKTYEIKKFAFGKMCQSFEHVSPIVALIEHALSWPKDKKGIPKPSRDQMMTMAVQCVSMMGPSVMGLVSVATEEPIEWLEEQDDVLGGLAIFAKVVEKNLDFFTPENIKRFGDLFVGLLGKIPQGVGK